MYISTLYVSLTLADLIQPDNVRMHESPCQPPCLMQASSTEATWRRQVCGEKLFGTALSLSLFEGSLLQANPVAQVLGKGHLPTHHWQVCGSGAVKE